MGACVVSCDPMESYPDYETNTCVSYTDGL
jgi:hypothetical protein